jgi:two-component system sensor histidine kinase UhpB
MKPEPQDLIDGLLNFVSLAEEERKLIAAELHDQLLSDLRELSIGAHRLLQTSPDHIPEAFRSSLIRLLDGLDRATNEARRIMENLRPSVLDSFGLLPALESCLRSAAACSNPPFTPCLQALVSEDALRLSEDEELTLYRIVQEALTNVSRHARASSVQLKIHVENGALVVQVRDDGVGLPDMRRKPTRGMENMRFRAQLIRARIDWRSNHPNPGTTVELRMALKE